MRALALVAGLGLALLAGPAVAPAQEATPPLPAQAWPFEGIFGTFDRAAAQRGFQVYNEVCSNCHSLKLVAYGDLGPDGAGGGLGFSADEVKAIAAAKQVPDTNDQGEATTRAALPADHFVPPFANEKAARAANNGGLPPDLSVIVKAREGGPDYIYALLTGYKEPPASMKMGDGMNYNEFFPGHQIAMPQPLNDNSVTYGDGTQATLSQEAYDVVNFLAWAAEPTLDERHRTGIKVILFLLVLTGILYAGKRRIWAAVH
ncbi:MAG TPA: cytochrome c1 [Stellaceae bacterium]|nr:cytochrome c1 [Stellaceae bacterium]